jgi:hypothetical protein
MGAVGMVPMTVRERGHADKANVRLMGRRAVVLDIVTLER